MARRTTKSPSRLELRKQVEAAESLEGQEKEKAPKAAKKKAAEKPKVKKTTKKKKTDPSRMRIVWGVFDNSNQQVATFPYPERMAAEKRATELTERGRGGYFIQPVKEPLPADDPKLKAEASS